MNQTPDSTHNEHTITLLRHGESTGNADRIHQGQAHFGLTDRGREQAQQLVRNWFEAGKTFDHIISSPLPRALQTAEIIAEGYHLPVNIEPDWQEWDVGKLSGLGFDEATEKYPPPPFISLYEPIGQIGESIWQMYLRAARVMQSLIRQPPGRYLIVSHGGILNMALHAILGMVPQPNFEGCRFRFDNCAHSDLLFQYETKRWTVIHHNTPHIADLSEWQKDNDSSNIPIHRFHFVFLRHGESQGNEEGVIQGQSNFQLTERGIDQASVLANAWHLSGVKFNEIIASPLSRAKETAEMIANRLDNPVSVHQHWMERDFGSLTGIRGSEIWSHPDMRGFFHPYHPVGESGESQWDLYLRASEAILQLLHRPPGRYLIVAHGGILNMVLRVIFGISPQRNLIPPRFYFFNTAYANIFFNPEKDLWRIYGINQQVNPA